MMRNLLSDELNTGGSRSDQPMLQEFNESAISVTNAVVKGYFQDLYKLIYKAHLVMEHFDPESATKKRAIAEAHFFRACTRSMRRPQRDRRHRKSSAT